MKNLKITGSLAIMLTVLILFSGCSQDDVSTKGTLQVTFANFSTDLEVLISPAENTNITLFNFHPSDLRNGTMELNIGNYFVSVFSSGSSYGSTGFQISSDKVTSIFWNSQNDPRVE